MDATETRKTTVLAKTAAIEYGQNQKEACIALKETKQEGICNQKLWKEGNKSKLIQIGMALIVFPEPTPISEIVGAGFVAAGAIQKGIRNQSLYMNDIPKDLKNAFKEISTQKANLKL